MLRLAPLLVVLALAGCATPQPGPAPGAPATHPWGLSHCAFVIANVAADPAKLAARLPPGFRLANGTLSGLPAGARAEVALDAYRCETGIGFAGNLTDVSYGSHYASIVPPDALREKGYEAYFVKWDPLIPDAARRDALVAAGLSAHGGDAKVALADVPGGGSQVDATLRFDDGGGFRLVGTTGAATAQGAPLPFMEYTPLSHGGLARWHARLHDARIASGQGVVEISTPWVRDVVGADRAPATFIAGEWNLDEADVAWPVAWNG
jgi:hypothetical protein